MVFKTKHIIVFTYCYDNIQELQYILKFYHGSCFTIISTILLLSIVTAVSYNLFLSRD